MGALDGGESEVVQPQPALVMRVPPVPAVVSAPVPVVVPPASPPAPPEPPEPSGTHAPSAHFPVEQGVPSGTAGLSQAPVSGSQAPAEWQSSAASHFVGSAPVQVPVWQVSDWVQASPSSQGSPSGFTGSSQVPV